MTDWNNLREGDKVFIDTEKMPYKVQCRNDRYIICTKPYNPKRTVFYFIVDLLDGVRGTDDRVFCFGYETTDQCKERLKDLESGRIGVSMRNRVTI